MLLEVKVIISIDVFKQNVWSHYIYEATQRVKNSHRAINTRPRVCNNFQNLMNSICMQVRTWPGWARDEAKLNASWFSRYWGETILHKIIFMTLKIWSRSHGSHLVLLLLRIFPVLNLERLHIFFFKDTERKLTVSVKTTFVCSMLGHGHHAGQNLVYSACPGAFLYWIWWGYMEYLLRFRVETI